MIPRRTAMATASVRSLAPSFSIMCLTWTLTVSSVMNSRPEKDRILGHDYDGIREYDNPLAGWWVLVFYVSFA